MLVVIPVSNADEKLIPDFTSCLTLFGPYVKHDLLIVCRPSDALYGVRLFNKTRELFKSANIHVFNEDGIKGWPQGPNHYWKQTILFLNQRTIKTPWLWMELDMTPLKRGWLDTLEEEYKECGKPCLGWVQDTTTITSDGVVVPIGKHLVGAGIYPADIDTVCKVWAYVDKISTAFDVLCQWELVPVTHHSLFFQHCFRTQNYKEIAMGCMRGEDNNNFPGGLRFDETIRGDAVLHHGCDDGSLARLLVSLNGKRDFND